MKEIVFDLERSENLPILGKSIEPKQKVLKLLIFQCMNRICELEFLILEDNSNAITYCPKCKGMIVKKEGILRVGIVNPREHP
jgi:hypothetical protein